MKLKEILLFIVGFNMVMWLFGGLGYTLLEGNFSGPGGYLGTLTWNVIGGALAGLAGAAVTSIFFRERAGERTLMFVSLSTFVFALIAGSFALFDTMFGQYGTILNVILIIKVFVYFTMLFTIYQLVFGGWGAYE